MLNTMAKNIIIKALKIRKERGEDPASVLETWPNLTVAEKKTIKAEFDSQKSRELAANQRLIFFIKKV